MMMQAPSSALWPSAKSAGYPCSPMAFLACEPRHAYSRPAQRRSFTRAAPNRFPSGQHPQGVWHQQSPPKRKNLSGTLARPFLGRLGDFSLACSEHPSGPGWSVALMICDHAGCQGYTTATLPWILQCPHITLRSRLAMVVQAPGLIARYFCASKFAHSNQQ